MDNVAEYRHLIACLFEKWIDWPGPQSKFRVEAILDEKNDRYLLVMVGWDKFRRIHDVLVHVEIIDGKIWIQRDDTKQGFAAELLEAGVPKECIVLAFYPEAMRQYGDFAIA